MAELLTAAQMRAVEQAGIKAGKVTGLELMERAGRGLVEAMFKKWPELAAAPHHAVILCGPGNNGGDGFVVARLLKEWGWEVEVFLCGDPKKMPPDAKVNYERWLERGEVLDCAAQPSRTADVYIDALFGTGLSRRVSGAAADALDAHCTHALAVSAKRVAVDIPSGICSDSGKRLGPDVSADLTVTFHSEKLGHRLAAGAEACGDVTVADIGVGANTAPPPAGSKPETECGKADLDRVTVLLEKAQFSLQDGGRSFLFKDERNNKFDHGHALLLSGGPGKTGAARLAARGALRIGAGLVTLGAPPASQQEVAAQITAVMLRQAGTPDEVAAVLEDDRFNAVCLGPGLGIDRARQMVPVILQGTKPRPTVLDADALTGFADKPEALFEQLHAQCVLTPHGGEFARLFPDIAKTLNGTSEKGPAYSKVDATREAAKRAGCVVLFKGPDTVIAAPDGSCSINSAHYDRSAPWLATAGSGDVLAGFVTGLLARGFAPMQATETAAWLHLECALEFGPGLIAEDLPEMLPTVFRELRGETR